MLHILITLLYNRMETYNHLLAEFNVVPTPEDTLLHVDYLLLSSKSFLMNYATPATVEKCTTLSKKTS